MPRFLSNLFFCIRAKEIAAARWLHSVPRRIPQRGDSHTKRIPHLPKPRKSACHKIPTLLHCPFSKVTRGDYRKTQGFKILNPLPVYRSDMRRRATLLHMSHRFSPPIREARCRGAQIPEFIPLGDHLVHFTSKHRRYPRTNRNVRLHAMI